MAGYNGYGSYTPYSQQMMQNRLNNMEQQYNMYPQNNYQMQNMQQMNMNGQQYIKGRPVSSFDEAKASMIDLDGSLFVFTDVANKRIYTKQILLDGSAELKTYVLEEQNIPTQAVQSENNKYVLQSDFDKAMKDIEKRLAEVIDNESSASNSKSNVRK